MSCKSCGLPRSIRLGFCVPCRVERLEAEIAALRLEGAESPLDGTPWVFSPPSAFRWPVDQEVELDDALHLVNLSYRYGPGKCRLLWCGPLMANRLAGLLGPGLVETAFGKVVVVEAQLMKGGYVSVGIQEPLVMGNHGLAPCGPPDPAVPDA